MEKVTLDELVEYIKSNNKSNKRKKKELSESLSDSEEEHDLNKPLEYLTKKKIDSFGKNLDDIYFNNLENTYFREGSIKEINENNISFYYSILFLLFKEKFNSLELNQKITFIEIFIKLLKLDVNSEKFNKFKTLGWKKESVMNYIKNNEINKILLRYISEYLHVNIFIIDLENQNILFSGENPFIKYKKNLFLLKLNENDYEPLFSETKIFPYSSEFIKLIESKSYLIKNLYCDLNKNEVEEFKIKTNDHSMIFKKRELNNETNDLINCFNESSDNENLMSDVNENIKFISERETEINIKEIEKMQVKELREVAKENDILLKLNNGKLKTKKQLCEEIKQIYN